VKVGDLVKMPSYYRYWWADETGIIDLIEPDDSSAVKYRVYVPGKGYARFNDLDWVEVISESR
tara:strand:- start:3363 stop:3551 length:189 start_codon:yes stop_codon:yes gene_type:complete